MSSLLHDNLLSKGYSIETFDNTSSLKEVIKSSFILQTHVSIKLTSPSEYHDFTGSYTLREHRDLQFKIFNQLNLSEVVNKILLDNDIFRPIFGLTFLSELPNHFVAVDLTKLRISLVLIVR